MSNTYPEPDDNIGGFGDESEPVDSSADENASEENAPESD